MPATRAAPAETPAPAGAGERTAESKEDTADRQDAFRRRENRLDGSVRPLGSQARAGLEREAAAAAQPLSETVSVASESAAPEIEIPAPGARWRIRAGRQVERSTSNGASWDAVAIPAPVPELTAGSAVSPTVCWLVGRGGAVYFTTDGVQFVRVSFPETADLVAVRATDERSATVTAADGRSWRTADQGRLWTALGR
jgi:photosystem II stability/assembly factor-like uncharacterized protein